MSFIGWWLILVAVCIGVAFVWKIKFKTNAFTILVIVSLVPMLVSLFFIPLDKGGHIYLAFSIPYLLAGALGAVIGSAAAHVFGKDPVS